MYEKEGLTHGVISLRSYDRGLLPGGSGNTVLCRIPFERIVGVIKWVRLLGFTFNNTIATFQTGKNDTMRIQETGASAGTFSFQIPKGTYSQSGFESTLKNLLDSNSLNSYNYEVSISPTTQELTISVSAGTFALIWDTTNAKMDYETGWGDQNDTALSTSHTSPFPVDLSGPKYIYLRVRNFLPSYTCLSGNGYPYHFVCEIDGGFGDIIYWSPQKWNREQIVFSKNPSAGFDTFVLELSTDRNNRGLDIPGEGLAFDWLNSEWILNLEVVTQNLEQMRY